MEKCATICWQNLMAKFDILSLTQTIYILLYIFHCFVAITAVLCKIDLRIWDVVKNYTHV